MAMKSDKHAAARAARIAQMPPSTPPELVALAGRIRGIVVVPGMADYAEACAGNPLYPAAPQAVVFCAVPNDVVVTLQTTRDLGLPLTTRSGRHSTAGFSINDGIVIDVSLMNHVVVDHETKTARVGAGANFGQLNAVLDTYMLHVPGGTCADVGVAGFTQGGGYGFTSRQFGINCDNVVGVTLVLADGRIVSASEHHNKDLWWAVCGGTGNNFGVLLEVRYRLAPVYQLWGFCLQWDAADAPAALDKLQTEFMRGGHAPDAVGYQCALSTLSDGVRLVMMGMFDGSREDGMAAIAPLQATGSPHLTFDQTDTYANLNDALLAVLPGPGPVGTFEAKRSRYLAKPLGVDGWGKVVDFFLTTPNPFNIIGIEPYGGAIEKAPVNLNAFIHRTVDMDIFVDSFWQTDWQYNDEQTAWAWADDFVGVIETYSNGEVYQNYPERDLIGYRAAYWGDAFDRLLAIKQAADPNNLFDFPQSITPDPAGPTRPAGPATPAPGPVEIAAEPYSPAG